MGLRVAIAAFWTILTVGASWLIGYKMGQESQIPVCHAIQEDSVITGCDYHNGTWWTNPK